MRSRYGTGTGVASGPAHWIEEGGCCYYCGGDGGLLSYAHRDQVPTLAQRLATLFQRLDGSATPPPTPDRPLWM